MTNRLFHPMNFREALQEQTFGIFIPFQHRLRVAQRRAASLNELTDWITEEGLAPGTAILGPPLRYESYSPDDENQSSGLVVQAALLIPGGLGVLLWDTEEVTSIRANGQPLERWAWIAHVPFVCELLGNFRTVELLTRDG